MANEHTADESVPERGDVKVHPIGMKCYPSRWVAQRGQEHETSHTAPRRPTVAPTLGVAAEEHPVKIVATIAVEGAFAEIEP